MTERDVETIVQRALEQHPNQKPRIISDNGPQFIAGLQGVHPCGWNNARTHQPALSPVQREARALTRQPEERVRKTRWTEFTLRSSETYYNIC